mmetsp:Transcript_104083/g.222344  ORF Transcript_104083/g.222344 Transcript_104083/m.222344 type:complete len:213 (-) Transcript_104083:45-683(-)
MTEHICGSLYAEPRQRSDGAEVGCDRLRTLPPPSRSATSTLRQAGAHEESTLSLLVPENTGSAIQDLARPGLPIACGASVIPVRGAVVAARSPILILLEAVRRRIVATAGPAAIFALLRALPPDGRLEYLRRSSHGLGPGEQQLRRRARGHRQSRGEERPGHSCSRTAPAPLPPRDTWVVSCHHDEAPKLQLLGRLRPLLHRSSVARATTVP